MDSSSAAPNDNDDATDSKLPKRTIAMHVAYVGTPFKGSSINRSLGEDATVEAVLERALLKGGFISSDNFGSFHKMKWSRASRTDKGVHSLGTVTALRMTIDDSLFHDDPEGRAIAESINEHLPPVIRVLCVQKVNKKFNARHLCESRSYEYYLPCSMIGMKGDGAADDSDRDKIERFRSALRVFEGNKAFHNYTKVKPHDGSRDLSKRYSLARQAEAAAAKERGEDPRVPADVIKAEMKRQAQEAKGLLGVTDGTKASAEEVDLKRDRDEDRDDENDEGEDDGEDDECEVSDLEDNPDRPKRPQYEKGAAIKGSTIAFQEGGPHISPTYYRKIFSFTAEDPEPLTPGGFPCLRLRVHGQSFLLHHIRHMIGSAVAVTLGIMPLEAVEASLSPPSKIVLPLAPSHTLLLSDTEFRSFPLSYGAEAGDVLSITGPKLRLRDAGVKSREDFRTNTLHKALQTLIDLPEWNEWKESLLRHGKETYRAEVLDPFLVQFRDWKEVQRTRKVEREAAGLGEEKTHKKWQKKDKKGEGKTQWWDKKKRKVS